MSPVGGFWRRKRKGDEGDEAEGEAGEDEEADLRWVGNFKVRDSWEGEMIDVLLQKIDEDGEKTGELERATEQDMVDFSCFLIFRISKSKNRIFVLGFAGFYFSPSQRSDSEFLKSRKCTAYYTLGPVLISAGASWVEPNGLVGTVVDGNIITGVTYRGHPEYIAQLLKALGGKISGADKRILFLCGDYMEDYEVTVPFQSLQALGCHVDAVCPKKKAGDLCPTAVHDFDGDQTYSEKPGHTFTLTADFDCLDATSYDALVIPGGRSPEYLATNKDVIAIVKEFMESRKPVASICHGQQILAAAGVLEGRKCTAYPAVKLNVVLAGATWREPSPITRCFTDGNLVTGAAWPGHPEFISQLMALLGIQVSFS